MSLIFVFLVGRIVRKPDGRELHARESTVIILSAVLLFKVFKGASS